MSLFTQPVMGQQFLEIEKLQKGDPESFQLLYRLFYEELLQEAQLLLPPSVDASAIVRHSFIKCWLQSHALSSLDYTLAFLLTTIRKKCNISSGKGAWSSHQDQVMKTILSATTREGMGQEDLLNDINRHTVETHREVMALFRKFYGHHLSVSELSQAFHLPIDYVQHNLKMAFKILHFIFSEIRD